MGRWQRRRVGGLVMGFVSIFPVRAPGGAQACRGGVGGLLTAAGVVRDAHFDNGSSPIGQFRMFHLKGFFQGSTERCLRLRATVGPMSWCWHAPLLACHPWNNCRGGPERWRRRRGYLCRVRGQRSSALWGLRVSDWTGEYMFFFHPSIAQTDFMMEV